MSEHDERAELAAGYALGSLTAEERAEYEEFLAESERGRLEADAFARASAALAADVPTDAPPPDLKTRLMAQIATTPQHAPAASEAPSNTVTVTSAHMDPTVTAATPARVRAERRWFQRPAVILVAAASAAVLFAGGTVLGANLGTSTSVTAQQADTLAQISAAPDVERTSAPVAGGGTATLVWSAGLGKSAMVVDGVAPAPSGKTYQLWYIRGGHATSAGLMTEGSWHVLHGTMRAGDTVGITIEPQGGSTQPTTKPVVAIPS